MLKLVQDKLGDQERAFQESGLTQVRHAPVNNHAGIKNLSIAGFPRLPNVLVRSEDLLLPKPCTQHEPQVRQTEEKQEPADVKENRLHIKDDAADPFNKTG